MYVLNDFNKALRLFVSTNAALDIDVKFPTVKQNVNGHIRFYTPKVSIQYCYILQCRYNLKTFLFTFSFRTYKISL